MVRKCVGRSFRKDLIVALRQGNATFAEGFKTRGQEQAVIAKGWVGSSLMPFCSPFQLWGSSLMVMVTV